MEERTRILTQLNQLPKGYISHKEIHSNKYYYLQWVENGKLLSRYIPFKDLDFVKAQINLRHKLEEELKEYQRQEKKIPNPSRLARDLTGYLMRGDSIVAEFLDGKLISKDDKLCPLYIFHNGDLSAFLASRVIDSSRTNARLLKKALGINEPDDAFVSLYSHGAVLTDNYWFKAKFSKLRYEDVVFSSDVYNEIALNGDMSFFPKVKHYSPQLSLTGSYEKCWRKIDGTWWLYKKGSKNELFSELLATQIAFRLGLKTVIYEFKDGCVRSENFASEVNFEPMTSIAGEDDAYEHVFSSLLSISKEAALSYLQLIWFDSLLNNVDRHNENCGLLRRRDNGEILGLAPNFDNNLSLIARNAVLNNSPESDGFISYFTSFIKKNKEAREAIKSLKFKEVTEQLVFDSLDSVYIKIPNERELVNYIVKRYQYLKYFISNL